MKTLIIALNSKYIHSALAPWYLKAACGTECGEVCVAEYTVNETIDGILSSIYLHRPDIAAFSCYIWNISHVLKLAASLKKLLPGTVIMLGGPEVSYDADDILKKHAFIDCILAGEGERSFPRLIKYISAAGHIKWNEAVNEKNGITVSSDAMDYTDPKHIDGLSFRKQETYLPRSSSKTDIITNAPALVEVLDSIASPYTEEMISSLKNRIVYFEASRGCPFSCSYCLSSATEGTRYFSLDRVFTELDRLVTAGVRQIKFVDRTFNSHKKRAVEIIRHIVELDRQIATDCNFHFEVGADLFDEEMLQLLENAPKGLFQIEAGLQTTNEAALAAVCRKTNTSILLSNLARLQMQGNVHIHADLIAGLPNEDYTSFKRSFDMLYASGPHQLQLGFLKFLKGTKMREGAEYEGYEFNDFPPYEILSGRYISYEQLIVLKGIAELVERYYNSSRFIFSLRYIIENCFKSPFCFFENFYFFHKKNGYMELHTGVKELYSIFNKFASDSLYGTDQAEFSELLRLDFLASDSSGTLPDFMKKYYEPGFNGRCLDFLKNSKQISKVIPQAECMTAKQLFKKVHFERFKLKFTELDEKPRSASGGIPAGTEMPSGYDPGCKAVLLFNYITRDKVTGRYPFFHICLS